MAAWPQREPSKKNSIVLLLIFAVFKLSPGQFSVTPPARWRALDDFFFADFFLASLGFKLGLGSEHRLDA